ncbi:MAG: hypothetical protein ACKOW2_06700 [Sphingobacteriaceae bacterium]
MFWRTLVVAYLLLNVLLMMFFKRMLSRRLHNPTMAWLLSISLSLSLTFLLALLIIAQYLKRFH